MATPDEDWSAKVAARIAAEEDATPADVDAFRKGDKSKLLVNALQSLSLLSRAAPLPAVVVAAATSPVARDEPDASRAAEPPAQSSLDISSFF